MNKLSDNDRSFLQLLMRSPDLGDGWRQSSEVVWPLVAKFSKQELVELDNDNKRVRLTPDGDVLVRYL